MARLLATLAVCLQVQLIKLVISLYDVLKRCSDTEVACVMGSAQGSWEPIDEDAALQDVDHASLHLMVLVGSTVHLQAASQIDIMALIDDEPEGIAMIQKDARLTGGNLVFDIVLALFRTSWPALEILWILFAALMPAAAAAGCRGDDDCPEAGMRC